MATPTLLSVSNVALPSSADSGNVTVTAPSGANACVIGGTGYLGDNNVPTSLTGSQLSAVNLLARNGNSGAFMTVWAAHAKVLAAGSQTIRLQKTGTWGEGPTCQIIWLTVDNPDDFVRAWTNSGGSSNLAAPDDFAALSVTIASTATDLVVGMYGKDSNDSLVAPTGTTQQGTTQTTNSDSSLAFKVTTPGASTTTVTTANISYPTLFAIALKEGSGGGGSQNLTVPLLTRSKTLYTPVVTRGSVSVLPPLLTRSKTVYAATVMPGAVNVLPPLLTRSKTLYAPVVTQGGVTLQPPLLTRSKTLYAPTVAPGSVTISPGLLTRSKTVFAPVVSPGGVTISPPLLTRAKTLYSPTISVGAVTLSPPLVTRAKVLYPPTVVGQGTISPPLVTRVKVLYAPTVTPGSVSLLPPLVTRVKVIYAPTVVQAATQSLFPPLLVRDKTVFSPTVSDGSIGSNLTQAAPGLIPKIWPGLSIRYEGKPKQRVEQLDEEERERIEEIAEQAVIEAANERTKKAMKASLQASMRMAELELAAGSYMQLVEQAALLRAEQIEEEDIAFALVLM